MENEYPRMEIRTITSIQTFEIRHPILRAGQPLESCKFIRDDDDETLHFGAYDKDNLTGVLSCYVNNGAHFTLGKNYQIRGVAVVEKLQQHGIGKVLMLHAEKALKAKGCDHVWLNSRIIAKSFYTKLDYLEIGTVFEVPIIGVHQSFYKKLKQ